MSNWNRGYLNDVPGIGWSYPDGKSTKDHWAAYENRQKEKRFKWGKKEGQFWDPKRGKWVYLKECTPFEGVDPETGYIKYYCKRTWPVGDGRSYDTELYKKVCKALGVESLIGCRDSNGHFYFY